jgi:hypothetical protein
MKMEIQFTKVVRCREALRGNFIAMNSYIKKKKKRERFLNNLMIHHKDLEKLDKLKPN